VSYSVTLFELVTSVSVPAGDALSSRIIIVLGKRDIVPIQSTMKLVQNDE